MKQTFLFTASIAALAIAGAATAQTAPGDTTTRVAGSYNDQSVDGSYNPTTTTTGPGCGRPHGR